MKTNEKILLIILILIILYQEFYYSGVKVESRIDGKEYIVQNFKNKESASDLLAHIQHKINILFDYLRIKHGQNESVRRLLNNFNPNNISEGSLNSEYTTYTLNKGEKIVFCLRTKKDSKRSLHDINTLMYVAIHELSHIMSVSLHHTNEFHDNFKFLLDQSQKCGVYKYVDYSKNPTEYCGIIIK